MKPSNKPLERAGFAGRSTPIRYAHSETSMSDSIGVRSHQ